MALNIPAIKSHLWLFRLLRSGSWVPPRVPAFSEAVSLLSDGKNADPPAIAWSESTRPAGGACRADLIG
jgi:hypothetical protein